MADPRGSAPTNPRLALLHDALRAEEHAERAEFEGWVALALEDQIAVGYAWPPLLVTDVEQEGPSFEVRAVAPAGVVLHDAIAVGSGVRLEAGVAARGRVVFAEGAVARIRLARGATPPSVRSRVVVRRHFDPITFVRYRQSLELADGHRSDLARALLADAPGACDGRAMPHPDLDHPQQIALWHGVRGPELAGIWGPPGTGKTRVLARILAALVREGDRPWALSDSNAAVDHLVAAAQAVGLDVVRLGPASRIDPELQASTVPHRVRAGPWGSALRTLDRDLSRAEGAARRRLERERDALWEQAERDAIARAQVIATTFGTLARVAPDLPPARTAVVDEATQVSEPALWVPVPFVERLVVAGDPEQLGPVSRVPGSPLGASVLARWIAAGADLPMLQVQHRMAPEIRALVASVYGDTYRDAATVSEHAPRLDASVLWIDTSGAGGEQQDGVTHSTFEPLEVRVAALAVTTLELDPTQVGVIAPYAAQVSRLRARPELANVEVATVNAFQGREKEAIVVSFVRSNSDGALGFVADERRLTVALTRARRQLVLIGDASTLGAHPRFAELLDRLEARGAVRSVWSEPWSAALDA